MDIPVLGDPKHMMTSLIIALPEEPTQLIDCWFVV